jgi:hypothetical protein
MVSVPMATSMNWLGLAEGARSRAEAPSPDPRHNEEWADVVARALQAAAQWQGVAEPTVVQHVLTLRCHLIKLFGVQVGDAWRDPHVVVDLFQRNSPLTLAETTRLIEHRENLPVSRLRELRVIKNMLGPMSEIRAELATAPAAAAVEEWLALLPGLP